MNKITENIPLSNYSSYKIGGLARFLAEFGNESELLAILKEWREISKDFSDSGKRVFILGGGTNILIDDNGFDGLVIRNKINEIKVLSENILEVGAGVLISDLLDYCIENSLSGLEWAGGLPGTVGGAVRGNAGAFGGEIKDSSEEVISYISTCEVAESPTSQVGEEIRRRKNSECNFGYRNSIFKTNPSEIIIEVVLSLKKGNKDKIENQINEKIEYRKLKHPNISDHPNIGSTFKNVPVENLPENVKSEFEKNIKTDPFPLLPAVKLISGAGLVGQRVGDIVVSEIHPNYLINLGNGKSGDVLSLIDKIKDEVFKKYKVKLEEEICLVGY